MKNLRTILCLLLTICLAACSDDNDIQFTKGDIPRDIAYQLALKELNVSLKDVDIWATKEKLPTNTKIEAGASIVTSPNSESWLFFVDEIPMANWGHDCQYLFVDMNGKISSYNKSMPPGYEKYNMELINISETTKNDKVYPIVPQIEAKSRNSILLENHYAIILSGGYHKEINYMRYWNDCAYIYGVLTNQYGYDPTNIYVLMSDGSDPGIDLKEGISSNTDLDGDGIADIDYAATNNNLNYVFNQLATQLTDEDYLFIYTIDHGDLDENLDESFICMWNYEKYYASEFANKVKAINTKATHIVMGQCKSGGFIPYFTDCSNICISTACSKYENSRSMANNQYDEYVYYWTTSHISLSGDANNDGYISALEAHNYAKDRDTQAETPQHYGAGSLSEKLTLTDILIENYGSYIDGYCVYNYDTDNKYSFYAEEPNHEPEFGVVCGDKIDITITYPEIGLNSFSWSIVENNSYTAIFVPNNIYAHLEVGSQAPIGQRIRVKVEADIPLDDYYIAQYLNFYITSNYRIARSENNVLSIENINTDNSSATYTLSSSTTTFTYQIMDEGTNNVRISGSYPKDQKLDLDISQLHNGVYTLIIRENGEIKANQRLTI